MFFYASSLLIITIALFKSVSSADLCAENNWFDDQNGECKPCRVCPEKSFEMVPCMALSNTMCVNLVRSTSIRVELSRPDQILTRHKWHEMEGVGEGNENVLLAEEKKMLTQESEKYDNFWSQVICVMLSLTTISIAVAVIMMAFRYIRKTGYPCDNRTVNRNRLFSRDRLNTTEYMKNLATLDRRLAIDEILEKRKRAIFEPQLLHENIYTDEVFVDLSGVPRSLTDDHPYEELDPRKCLLQMKDQK